MPHVERDLRKIRQRLESEGWLMLRDAGPHMVFRHPAKAGRIIVPKGRGDLPQGTAMSIARAAGWL